MAAKNVPSRVQFAELADIEEPPAANPVSGNQEVTTPSFYFESISSTGYRSLTSVIEGQENGGAAVNRSACANGTNRVCPCRMRNGVEVIPERGKFEGIRSRGNPDLIAR